MSEASKDVEKNGKSQLPPDLEYGEAHGRRQKRVNQVPMGLFAFGSTAFLLSMHIVHTRHIQTNNLVVGMAAFAGGLTQWLAGQWSVALGDTFPATVLSSYGAFWMSYAMIFIPGSGIVDALGGGTSDEFNQSFGLYLMVWFVLTVLYIPPMLRKNVSFVFLLSVLALTFLLLSIGTWSGMDSVTRGGGAFGVITGLTALYIGVSMLMSAEPSALFHLPLGILSED